MKMAGFYLMDTTRKSFVALDSGSGGYPYMGDFGKGTGDLDKKKFVFSDPTGSNQTMKPSDRTEKIAVIQKAFKDHKNKATAFFG